VQCEFPRPAGVREGTHATPLAGPLPSATCISTPAPSPPPPSCACNACVMHTGGMAPTCRIQTPPPRPPAVTRAQPQIGELPLEARQAAAGCSAAARVHAPCAAAAAAAAAAAVRVAVRGKVTVHPLACW